MEEGNDEMQELKKQLEYLKLQDFQNPSEFKIKDIENYPNRLICYIKLKLNSKSNKASVYGTGCLIDQRYVLTSAHTLRGFNKQVSKFQKSPNSYMTEGYIKQALHEGKDICQYRIKINTIKMSKLYRSGGNKADNDFAIFEIEPLSGQQLQIEKKYMPIVALRDKEADKIKAISLYGYPYTVNKKQNYDPSAMNSVPRPSSLFMANAYGSKGAFVEYTATEISYKLPTDKGISGGPIMIFNEELKDHAIIGIHKAFNRKKIQENSGLQKSDQQNNFGVTALQMLAEVNEWGYELLQKPLVFTFSTLFLRNNPAVHKNDIFNLMDRNLDDLDMLVLSSYNLSHLKKLILSGNHLREIGLKHLLKRPFSSLESLFLSSNSIESLDSITEQEWKHIQQIKTLSLSLNQLKSLPANLKLLSELQKLWICYNNFQQIPEVVSSLNSEVQMIQRTVHIYENRLKKGDPEHLQLKKRLADRKVALLLNKYQK